MSDPTREALPPAPPNGCQTYHGVPGCRCQVRASRAEPHRGAHHCDEHDRYWTDLKVADPDLMITREWAERVADALSTTPAPDPECDCEPRHVWPCATIGRCDEPGCDREATCGWQTRPGGTGPNGGYRRTCGPHMRSTP